MEACEGQDFTIIDPVAGYAWTPNAITLKSEKMAASCGLGVAFLTTFHTHEHITDGTLQRILPDWGMPAPIYAVYPSQHHIPRKVRAFGDALTRCLTQPPWA